MSRHPRFDRISIICGGFGQQGYGYNVKYLYTEIGKILGLDRSHNFIIIGAGNLGQALANYASFEKGGFILKGLFDVNPRLEGVAIRGIPVRMMDELQEFLQNNEIEIAALTIPKIESKRSCRVISGQWNPGYLEFCTYRSESAKKM